MKSARMNHVHHTIVTLTFNPCIDKTTFVPQVIPDKKLKCGTPVFEPGGGGLNVARAIKRLGGNALAVYPSGGYSGKFLNELLISENIPIANVESDSHTRENLIVLDQSINKQYRFGMPGPVLSETEWQRCLDIIDKDEAGYIVVSGSFTPGLPPDLIARIAFMAKRKNKKLIADTSGEPLKLALQAGVYLVKPNLGELIALYGSSVRSLQSAEMFGKDIIEKKQSEIVLVSLGADGAFLITKDISLRIVPPEVKKMSTVGAGDSMVAGMVLKLTEGWPVEDAARYGVACGTAATMNAGTQLCKLHDATKLFNEISKTNKEVNLKTQ
jgi:6-phosphofructokinase 2